MPIKIVMLADSRSVHVKRWARSLVDRGLDLSVISLGGDDIEKVKIIKLPCPHNRTLGFIRQAGTVKKLIDQLQPDLIHAHYASSYGFWGWWSRFHPFVLSVWGTDVIEFPGNIVNRFFLKRIIKAADKVTATGEFLKENAREYIGGDGPSVSVIPFGVDIRPLASRPESGNVVRLIFIKVHHKRYGPDVLLRAFVKALGKCPSLSLTMVGDGEMTAELKKMATTMGIADKVDFAGFIDNREIPGVLSAHDIMVMPSRREGFGVTALEAAACAVPTIAARVGGIPEVVLDEQTGLLVPSDDPHALADAIIRLAADAELRRRLGCQARAFVERRFNWDDNVEQMIDLYESLIKKTSP